MPRPRAWLLALLLLAASCGRSDKPTGAGRAPDSGTTAADTGGLPPDGGGDPLPDDGMPPDDGLPPDEGSPAGRPPGAGLWCGTPGDVAGLPASSGGTGPFSGSEILSAYESVFPDRERHRQRLAARTAPTAADDAIDAALRWLAAHQAPHGGWEAAGFGAWCQGQPVAAAQRKTDGAGSALHDVGVTGLAMCAFLGAGYTNRGEHAFARTVSRGLRYLKNVQDPEGCFGPRTAPGYLLDHAAATLAMVEALGMTGSPIFEGSAQRALDFVFLARTPDGVWGHGIKSQEADALLSGCMLLAVRAALWINREAVRREREPPLALDEAALAGVREWIDRPRGQDDAREAAAGQTGTAIRVLARLAVGEDPRTSAPVRRDANALAARPPGWDPQGGQVDLVAWTFATQALHQVGGAAWRTWRAAMSDALLAPQRKDTDACSYAGSWDPHGPGGTQGGRVFSTALMALCLEVFYRYPRTR